MDTNNKNDWADKVERGHRHIIAPLVLLVVIITAIASFFIYAHTGREKTYFAGLVIGLVVIIFLVTYLRKVYVPKSTNVSGVSSTTYSAFVSPTMFTTQPIAGFATGMGFMPCKLLVNGRNITLQPATKYGLQPRSWPVSILQGASFRKGSKTLIPYGYIQFNDNGSQVQIEVYNPGNLEKLIGAGSTS